MSAFSTASQRIGTAVEPLVGSLRARFNALQPRERQIVAIGAVALAIALLFVCIVQPVLHAQRDARQRLADARDLATELERASLITPANTGMRPQTGQSLLASVDQASKSGDLGKPLSRLQPDGEAQVRAWVEDVSFDALTRWMLQLQTVYGVRVDSVEIERAAAPGTVNARLSLVRAQ